MVDNPCISKIDHTPKVLNFCTLCSRCGRVVEILLKLIFFVSHVRMRVHHNTIRQWLCVCRYAHNLLAVSLAKLNRNIEAQRCHTHFTSIIADSSCFVSSITWQLFSPWDKSTEVCHSQQDWQFLVVSSIVSRSRVVLLSSVFRSFFACSSFGPRSVFDRLTNNQRETNERRTRT